MPQHYLVDIFETTTELQQDLTIAPAGPGAGQFNKDIYKLTLNLRRGDLVTLEGQVEVTNDTSPAGSAGFAVCIKLEGTGKQLSHFSSEWITPYIPGVPSIHHLPLRSACSYRAERDETIGVAINAHAWADSVAGQKLKVEPGYGHLLAKVFRVR
jgi:hypothetical protein